MAKFERLLQVRGRGRARELRLHGARSTERRALGTVLRGAAMRKTQRYLFGEGVRSATSSARLRVLLHSEERAIESASANRWPAAYVGGQAITSGALLIEVFAEHRARRHGREQDVGRSARGRVDQERDHDAGPPWSWGV